MYWKNLHLKGEKKSRCQDNYISRGVAGIFPHENFFLSLFAQQVILKLT